MEKILNMTYGHFVAMNEANPRSYLKGTIKEGVCHVTGGVERKEVFTWPDITRDLVQDEIKQMRDGKITNMNHQTIVFAHHCAFTGSYWLQVFLTNDITNGDRHTEMWHETNLRASHPYATDLLAALIADVVQQYRHYRYIDPQSASCTDCEPVMFYTTNMLENDQLVVVS